MKEEKCKKEWQRNADASLKICTQMTEEVINITAKFKFQFALDLYYKIS